MINTSTLQDIPNVIAEIDEQKGLAGFRDVGAGTILSFKIQMTGGVLMQDTCN